MTLDELKQAIVARVALPPEQGPPGKDGWSVVGAAGKDGKDGLSIVGQKGDPGPKGEPGRDGTDGQSVEKAKAHPLPWDQQPTADFFPETGLLDLGIPKGKPGERGPVGMSARGTFFGGGSGLSGGTSHPTLADHDTMGLATDAELASAIAAAIAVHAATPHGSDVPAEFGFTA